MTGNDERLQDVLRALLQRARQMADGKPSPDAVQLGNEINARFEQELTPAKAQMWRIRLDDPATLGAEGDALAKELVYAGADRDETVVRLASAILDRLPTSRAPAIHQVNKAQVRLGNNSRISNSFNQKVRTNGSAEGEGP